MNDCHWRPSASLELLRHRALLMYQIRDFFLTRGYLEVETPIMARFGITDVYLSNIKATFRGQSYCLQTSPEYHMKRLLAAGSGPIFQLARVFRDDELGRWHNPEFTLLEWYQLNIDHHQLMDEMDALLQLILQSKPMKRMTYGEVFQTICGINPHQATCSELKDILARFNLQNVLDEQDDRDQHLFLLMSHVIEPALAENDAPIAVYNFPATQAALAKIKDGEAERFEVYYRGVELANGFHELTDMVSQQERFEQDQVQRKARGLDSVPTDHYLLAALHHGLPACSGVALGVDRLIALALKQTSIASTMAFDISRA